MNYFTEKKTIYFVLLLILSCLLPQTNTAQSIRKLKNVDVSIKKLIKPLQILPDSIKTYQIVSRIEANSGTGINDAVINSLLSLESYEKKSMDADITIYVTVQKPQVESHLLPIYSTDTSLNKKTCLSLLKKGAGVLLSYLFAESLPDSSRYWYEERIKTQIKIEAKDRFGEVFFSKTGGLEWVYATEKKKTMQEAMKAFENRAKSSSYKEKIEEIHKKTLQKCISSFIDTYDYRSETISLYYPKEDEKKKQLPEASSSFTSRSGSVRSWCSRKRKP